MRAFPKADRFWPQNIFIVKIVLLIALVVAAHNNADAYLSADFISPPRYINEGFVADYYFDISSAGPGDAVTYWLSFGDGPSLSGTPSIPDTGSVSLHEAYRYTKNGTYTVWLNVCDYTLGQNAIITSTITVNNVAPTVSFSSAYVDPFTMEARISGTFTDPGHDVFSGKIDWGESGILETLNLHWTWTPEGGTVGTFEASYTYHDYGIFSPTVTVNDMDNGAGLNRLSLVVAPPALPVPDPSTLLLLAPGLFSLTMLQRRLRK